jgi:hypothetical protein
VERSGVVIAPDPERGSDRHGDEWYRGRQPSHTPRRARLPSRDDLEAIARAQDVHGRERGAVAERLVGDRYRGWRGEERWTTHEMSPSCAPVAALPGIPPFFQADVDDGATA